jgi:hypothetical protein
MGNVQTHQEWFWFIDNSTTLFRRNTGQWYTYMSPTQHTSNTRHGSFFTYCKLALQPCPPPCTSFYNASLECSSMRVIQIFTGCKREPLISLATQPPSTTHNISWVHQLLTEHPFYEQLISSSSIPAGSDINLSSSIAHGDLAVCCGGSFGIAFAEKLHPFWVCLVRTVVHPVSSLLT